jgi:hypothetical protein
MDLPASHRHGPAIALPGWTLMALALLLLCGCGEEREVIFSTESAPGQDEDRKAVQADIATLSKGKDLTDPDNMVAYHRAVDALIGRGARIETSLTDALTGSDDWGIRLGAVEVLKAVATRRSIEPLLGALEDPQPLVALNADHLLRGLTKHRVIPDAGQPAVGGLPPVPARDPKDLRLDAEEKVWAAWHREHHAALHRAWRTWWEANRATVVIE